MEASRRPAARRIAATWLLALAACGNSSAPAHGTPPIGKVLAALLDGADDTRAPWRCTAFDGPTPPSEMLSIGAHQWKLDGRALARKGGLTPSGFVVAVIADTGGAGPRTLAALGRLRALIDDASPDLVLTLGGMGSNASELEATLGTLSDHARWPVVALPGDLEHTTAQVAAIATLRDRGDFVFDGRLVRWIEVPGATIGTLPGVGAMTRMVAGDDGCAWRRDEVVKLFAELSTKKGLRIAASAEAPRLTVNGEASGELALVPSAELPIDVSIHGPVQPAPSPARTGARDGLAVALSPGTADATTRLPRPHPPAAGVLVVRRTGWSWRPLVDVK